jgi:hypothetical protein
VHTPHGIRHSPQPHDAHLIPGIVVYVLDPQLLLHTSIPALFWFHIAPHASAIPRPIDQPQSPCNLLLEPNASARLSWQTC